MLRPYLLSACLLGALAACGRSAAELTAVELGAIVQVNALDSVYVAGQPSADDLAAARDAGIATLVDLRMPEEPRGFDEAATAAELGLEYVTLPWNGPEMLTDEVFARGRELLAEAPRPLLMHCGSANRIGPLWIAWRTLDGGLELEAAVEEARQVGLRTPAYEELARDYVAREGLPAAGE